MKILKLLRAILIILTLANLASTQRSRIASGVAQTDILPYLVSIQDVLDDYHFCGGIILDERHVLSAAHCCFSAQNLGRNVRIVAGEVDFNAASGFEQTVFADHFLIHEDYDDFTLDNDICIITLESNLVLSDSRRVLKANITDSNSALGDDGDVYGWGKTSSSDLSPSSVLMKARMPILSDAECSLWYSGDFDERIMLCAGGNAKDACELDGGGPLVTVASNLVCGLVSFGAKDCSGVYPGVYTKLSSFTQWISDNLTSE